MSMVRSVSRVLRRSSALPRSLAPIQLVPQQARYLHATRKQDSLAIVGGAGVAVAALSAKYLLQSYQEYKANKAAAATEAPAGKNEGKAAASERGSFFNFNMSYRNFYDGPFEDKMTRREAALILGVRENASPDRIRNAHRKLLISNHPDTGGSTFLSTKINEAKEMLLNGK
ncbi:hypothetical protein SPRG_02142 [Saprolegnia parasitica CBS 223.65]|uniref:J domain-containing protein n=1 Tax=Saprolegnia parasitica (strain CBS 223.65) TaxID=695850 RepID=A0A067CRK8_SAPPC|nr:hypothetical protein SPRG_02142 [Saprolegnia parasitica CBS 223.65]KDO33334.1 hypothetical protein SPRG_02142 [Saprolegnia parasitica CBS 223.65]|eukprot:XP_012196083.1 hypothetical protein SPRG_02142 [Saprolegnia parasitica CBS 223.65]